MIVKVPDSGPLEAICIINMESSIPETDLEVIRHKLGRCKFNAILGDAGRKIPKIYFLAML